MTNLIDEEILTYSKWKKALEAEDVKELKRVVERSERVLYQLYDMYLTFQYKSRRKGDSYE